MESFLGMFECVPVFVFGCAAPLYGDARRILLRIYHFFCCCPFRFWGSQHISTCVLDARVYLSCERAFVRVRHQEKKKLDVYENECGFKDGINEATVGTWYTQPIQKQTDARSHAVHGLFILMPQKDIHNELSIISIRFSSFATHTRSQIHALHAFRSLSNTPHQTTRKLHENRRRDDLLRT